MSEPTPAVREALCEWVISLGMDPNRILPDYEVRADQHLRTVTFTHLLTPEQFAAYAAVVEASEHP